MEKCLNAMAGQTTDTVIDITKRFEWEVSREQIVMCPVNKMTCSPVFIVNTNNEVSQWQLGIGSKFPQTHSQKDGIFIFLVLLPGDVSLKVEVKGLVVRSEIGQRTGKNYMKGDSINVMGSKIEHFNGQDDYSERTCGIYVGFTEEFLKLFYNHKVTVMATLRFYMGRKDYIKEDREKNFLTHLRTTSDLDPLTDFTIICGDREFKCHRFILASRSTVFKTMLLNDHFVENRENSVTIENASSDTVEAMLEFISKGVVPRNIRGKAIDLINLADRYDLQDLIVICECSLVTNLTAENSIETLIAIDLHVPNSQHRQKILDFIKAKAAQVVKSSHWKEFLVKYPDLVAEIFLWAALPQGEANDN